MEADFFSRPPFFAPCARAPPTHTATHFVILSGALAESKDLSIIRYYWVRFACWVLWVRPAAFVGAVGYMGYMGYMGYVGYVSSVGYPKEFPPNTYNPFNPPNTSNPYNPFNLRPIRPLRPLRRLGRSLAATHPLLSSRRGATATTQLLPATLNYPLLSSPATHFVILSGAKRSRALRLSRKQNK